jgi:hypothetical protein
MHRPIHALLRSVHEPRAAIAGAAADAAVGPLWFVWAFFLLAVTGLLWAGSSSSSTSASGRPFSLLGIFMMIELAVVLFGITVALQRKRIAHRFAIVIALLPCPCSPGCPPCCSSCRRRGRWLVRAHGADRAR